LTTRIVKIGFQIAGLVAIVAAALYVASLAGESAFIRSVVADYGYVGIFITALFSGFNLAFPVPAAAFLPLFLESGLNYWLTIVLIAIGVTIADVIAYFIGRASRHIAARSSEGQTLRRLEAIRERYQWAPLLILFQDTAELCSAIYQRFAKVFLFLRNYLCLFGVEPGFL
jgi:membrane protein YqaA with SNARE-associated domain